jgi:uncharacterized protein (DUF433 family)
MDVQSLLKEITVSPKIFGGKPIIRGRRLAVAPVLSMLAAGDSSESICRDIDGWRKKKLTHA